MSTNMGQIISSRTPNNCQLTTGFNEVKTIDNCTTVTTDNCRAVDRALAAASDLITPTFKAWYAQQAYRIGADRFTGLASDARRGRQPGRLFSYLLRNA